METQVTSVLCDLKAHNNCGWDNCKCPCHYKYQARNAVNVPKKRDRIVLALAFELWEAREVVVKTDNKRLITLALKKAGVDATSCEIEDLTQWINEMATKNYWSLGEAMESLDNIQSVPTLF